ncbi:MAG: transporter substrate-binding domain-containing protein [Propionicimonas sp.]|uniref:transporter substrate-binding domain-containing protein n=1 Tax=Propionicimonas sp. TaxID=1955623 RepID=UPI003D14D212
MLVKKSMTLAASVAALALALTACTSSTPAAPASSEPASSTAPAVDYQLVTAGTLTVCSDVPYAPFEVEDATTASGYSGFDIDLMDAIATKLGLKLAVIDSDFDALQSGTVLVANQCDLAASAMTITDERKQNLDFSDPYYDSLQSLLVKTDSGITNLAGTAGKKIGVQKGTTGKSYATKNAPSTAEIVDFPSDGELWPAIQAGQIDAILQDQPVNHTHEVADPSYKIVETYNTDESYGFAYAKGKKLELQKAVNDQLTAMKSDGSYDALYKKYFG